MVTDFEVVFPRKVLLSRKDIVKATGLTNWEYRKMVNASILKPVFVTGNKRAKYYRDDVIRAIFPNRTKECVR